MKQKTFLEVMLYSWIVLIVIGVVMLLSLPADASMKAESNLSIRCGNVEGMESMSGISYLNETENSSLELGVKYSYNSSNYEKEGETLEVYGKHKQDLANKRYFYTFDVNSFYDHARSLQYRNTLGPGLGVKIISNKNINLTLDAGASYAVEKYKEADLDDKALLRCREQFSWQVADNVRLKQRVEFFPEIDELDRCRIEGEVSVTVDVTEGLGLKGSFTDTWNSHVGEGVERNDVAMSMGLVYEF